MPLLLGASEVTADCKVGLRSSWWNTAQDFSQVKGKWISLALLFSAKLVQKTQLSQSRVTQRGAQPAGFVRPPSVWNTRQSKIYTHPNSTCECRLKKNEVFEPLLMHRHIISVTAVKHLGWIPKVSHRKIKTVPPMILETFSIWMHRLVTEKLNTYLRQITLETTLNKC